MTIRRMKHSQEYIYDFSVDGGTQGEIVLSDKAGYDPLPVGAIVTGVLLKVLTAFTSAGSATLTWGTSADVDGFSGTAVGKASLTDNAMFVGVETIAGVGALIWTTRDSGTSATPKPYLVTSGDGQKVSVTIGTADLTAGKAIVLVEFYMPGLD